MGVVVGSSATLREISTGRVLILLSGATSSLISFTWVCSMIGDRSVALITATLSGTSFLAPDYMKEQNGGMSYYISEDTYETQLSPLSQTYLMRKSMTEVSQFSEPSEHMSTTLSLHQSGWTQG